MIEEVEQLRQFRLREDIRMTFLGASDQGLNATVRWDIPTQMPENLRRNPGLTWDILRSVMEVKDTLDLLDQEDEQRPPLEENYHNMLRQLGLDVTHADKLKRFGEFVPFYYRLAVAELIWASKPEGQKILGRELTRDKNTPPDQFVSLYDLLGIKLPSSDMLEGLFEPNINKMYFAYEQLRTLNDMLTKAAEGNRSNDDPAFRILEVSEVYLWAFSYLRKAPEVPRQPRAHLLPQSRRIARRRTDGIRFGPGSHEERRNIRRVRRMGLLGRLGPLSTIGAWNPPHPRPHRLPKCNSATRISATPFRSRSSSRRSTRTR